MALLDPSLIPARSNGQTIDETWFNILKTYLLNFFDEIGLIQSANTLQFNLDMPFSAVGNTTSMYVGVHEYTVTEKMTIDSAELQLGDTQNSTGELGVDVKRKRGAGAFETLFTIKPKCDLSEGDYESSDSGNGTSVAAIIDTVNELLLVGDIVRIDLVETPAEAITIEEHMNKAHLKMVFSLEV